MIQAGNGEPAGSLTNTLSRRAIMFRKSMLMTLALTGSMMLPMRSSAQNPLAGSAGAGPAAVSGVPIGPGSAGGANNSVYDPSGIGNAPKPLPTKPLQVPAPASSSTGLTNPAGYPPASYRLAPRLHVVARRGVRRAASSSRRSATNAAIRTQDRLLDRKLISICRGC
jgi:hypothetical protein